MEMSFKREFNEWRAAHPGIVVDTPQEAGIETELRVGQRVRFTNDYGVPFEPLEILGFCKQTATGGCVFLNKSSYWFPNKLSQITPYNKEKL